MKKRSITGRRTAGAKSADNLLMRVITEAAGLRRRGGAEAPGWASLIARFADGSALEPLPGREAERSGVTEDEVRRVVQFLGASMLLRLAEAVPPPKTK